MSDGMATWSTAKIACRILGMDLARIDSRREHNWVHKTFGQHKPWIGLNDKRREAHFESSDGCSRPYKKWAIGQPDNNDNEDCVHLWIRQGWNDGQCTRKKRFLCKRSRRNKRTRCGARITRKTCK